MTSPTAPSPAPPARPDVDRRLRRRDGPLGGVCAGIAQAFDVEVQWIRFAAIVGLFTGVGFFAYPAAWLLIPTEDDRHPDRFRVTDSGPRLWIGGFLAFLVATSMLPVAAFGGSSWLVAFAAIGAGVWLLNREPTATPLSSHPPPTGPAAAARSTVVAPPRSAPEPSPTGRTAPAEPGAAGAEDPASDKDFDPDEDPLLREARLLSDPLADIPLVPEPPAPVPDGSGGTAGGVSTWGTTWLDDEHEAAPPSTRRPPVTSVTLAVAALAIGGLMALDAIGWFSVGAVAYAGTAATILGVGIVASLFVGRALPLIPLFLIALASVPAAAAIDEGIENGVGERTHVVTSEADLADRYALGIGEIVLDLSQLELTEDRTVEIDLTMGGLDVTVPADVRVDVVTEPMIGVIDVQLDPADGSDIPSFAEGTTDDPRGTELDDEPVLTLLVDVGLGGGEIVRADS